MDKKGAGLKQPVLINIQEMAPQLQFKFVQDNKFDQALQGNRHRVDVYVDKLPNINLKSLNLHFDEIQSGEQGNFSQGLISMNQSQVMAEVDMES